MPVQSPAAPQWSRLAPGSTQEPPQSISPAWQLTAQVPPLQTSPGPHAVPASTLRLNLTYQPCDESSCLPGISKQIDIEVPSIH